MTPVTLANISNSYAAPPGALNIPVEAPRYRTLDYLWRPPARSTATRDISARSQVPDARPGSAAAPRPGESDFESGLER